MYFWSRCNSEFAFNLKSFFEIGLYKPLALNLYIIIKKKFFIVSTLFSYYEAAKRPVFTKSLNTYIIIFRFICEKRSYISADVWITALFLHWLKLTISHYFFPINQLLDLIKTVLPVKKSLKSLH